MTTSISVVVDSIHPLPNAGNLKAFVAVTVNGGLEIHGIRIIQQAGQRPFAALPQSESKSADGKTKYFPIMKFVGRSAGLTEEIYKAVLEAWQKDQIK